MVWIIYKVNNGFDAHSAWGDSFCCSKTVSFSFTVVSDECLDDSEYKFSLERLWVRWLFTKCPAASAESSDSSPAITVAQTIRASWLAFSPGVSGFGPYTPSIWTIKWHINPLHKHTTFDILSDKQIVLVEPYHLQQCLSRYLALYKICKGLLLMGLKLPLK